MASVTYSGTFGQERAGTGGQSVSVSGAAIPSGQKITSISYSLSMRAGGYSSSNNWIVHWFAIGSATGSPYASRAYTSMSNNSQTLYGTMNFSASDVGVFENGSFVLYAKANTDHSSTSYMGDFTITVNYTANTPEGAGITKSTGAQDKTSIKAGEEIALSISGNAAVTHNVTLRLGNCFEVKTAGPNGTVRFAPSYDYLYEIPRNTSGQASITLETLYNGVSQGTNVYYFTQNVPDDVIPTIGSIGFERVDNNVATSDWGIYVQNKSGVIIKADDCEGAYGSTITSYRFAGGVNAIASENSYTIDAIKDSGNITYTVTAVDSRGRTATKSATLYVYPYEAPTFSATSAARCDENGELSETGTYIWAKTGYEYSACGGKNDVVLTAEYAPHGSENWIEVGIEDMDADTPYVFGGGGIDLTQTYRVRFTLTDKTGSSSTKTIDVSTSQYTLFFKRGGQAVAFGKEVGADREKVVEISEDWTLLIGDVDIFAKIKDLEERIKALEG